MPTLQSILEAQNASSKEGKFFYAFGKFICTFANTESTIHQFFQRISGLEDPKARAIMGGARLIDVVSAITRLVPYSDLGLSLRQEVKELLAQLHHISTFRHALIHRGATVSETEITSHNILTAKTWENVEQLRFQLEHVKAATDDLNCIGIRLWAIYKPEILDGYPAEVKKYLYSPWRYKPVQPDKLFLPRNQKNQKNSHPRKSSPS